jgi:hypothetical protein
MKEGLAWVGVVDLTPRLVRSFPRHSRSHSRQGQGDFFVLDLQRGRLSHSTTTRLAQAPTLFDHPTFTSTYTYTYTYNYPETLHSPALGSSLDA